MEPCCFVNLPWALQTYLGKSPLILRLLQKEMKIILLQRFLRGNPWDNISLSEFDTIVMSLYVKCWPCNY